MKLKKNVVILFFLIIFVFIIGLYLYKNNDETLTTINSSSKKYLISFDNDFTATATCDKYYAGLGTKVFQMAEVTENFPVYVYEDCAVELDYFVNHADEENRLFACNVQKDYAKSSFSGSAKDIYNNVCKDLTGELTDGDICNNFSKKTSGSYNSETFMYEPDYTCVSETNPFKGKTGVLASSAVNVSYPIYLVNGCAWSFIDIFTNVNENMCVTSDFKRDVCEEQKKLLEGTNDYGGIFDYNSHCGSITGEITIDEYVYVKLNAYNSFGMECKSSVSSSNYLAVPTSKNNECIYAVKKSLLPGTITILASDLPNTANLKENMTGAAFSGWKRSTETENCNPKNTNLNIVINDTTVDEINYTACFEQVEIKNSQDYIIYNSCDNTFTKKNQGDATAQKVTGNASDLSNTARVNSQVITNKEFKVSNPYGNKLVSDTVDKFKINNYCSVTCTETFDYTYPTIFETVKSGTYFDLLSYPEATGKLRCTETFSYDNWEYSYIESIKDERKAYVDKVNDNTIDTMSFSPSGTCGCKETCCSIYGCWCCAYYTHYSSTNNYLTFNRSTQYGDIGSTSRTYSYCESNPNGQNTARNQARSDWGINNSVNYTNRLNSLNGARVSMENANRDCTNALFLTSATKDSNGYVNLSTFNSNKQTTDFYEVKNTSNMYFYYESDDESLTKTNNLGLNNQYSQEKLKPTNKYVNDTGVLYSDGSDLNLVNNLYSFSYPGCSNCTFNAKKTSKNELQRVVTNRYVFDKADEHKEYYSSKQTGKIVDSDHNESDDIYLGYVYPINLTLSGNRNVYFALDVETNFNGGVSNILSSVPNDVNDINVYKCDYDISNDVIIKDVKEDYKKNFYIRSISTSNVDPNNRIEKGQFGANWSNPKGQELIKIIEEKSKGNNTYNPNNLEYSFTLDALTIEAIREYNKDHKYSDFNLTCNDMSGECKSKFLSNLAGFNASNRNLVDGIEVNNVNAIMKRETWKYYINGSWLLTKSLTNSSWKKALDFTTVSNSSFSSCIDSSSAKKTYDCIYRNINEGVLP